MASFLVYIHTEEGPRAYFPLVTANCEESAIMYVNRAGMIALCALEVKK